MAFKAAGEAAGRAAGGARAVRPRRKAGDAACSTDLTLLKETKSKSIDVDYVTAKGTGTAMGVSHWSSERREIASEGGRHRNLRTGYGLTALHEAQ